MNHALVIPNHSNHTNLLYDAHVQYVLADGSRPMDHLDTQYIDLDIEYTDGSAEGRVQWNTEDGVPEIGLPGGKVNLPIGQAMLIRIKNEESVQINKGEVVHASTALGAVKFVKLANASDHGNAMRTVGVAAEDISPNGWGYIVSTGLVRGFDTDGFSDGQLVYLNTVDGKFVGTPPASPSTTVVVGIVVYPHQEEGILYVSISPVGYIEELSNVVTANVADRDLLAWDSGNTRWENVTLNSVLTTVDVANNTLTIHPSMIGIGKTFADAQAPYEALKTAYGTPATANKVYLAVGPGDYDEDTISITNIHIGVYELVAGTVNGLTVTENF